MLGHGALDGKINPEPGRSAEAVLNWPLDPLDKFGLAQLLTDAVARPWQTYSVARGSKTTAENKDSGGLLRVCQVASQINIYQVPVILVSETRPVNQPIALQPRRLPLNMVAPQLAWAPG